MKQICLFLLLLTSLFADEKSEVTHHKVGTLEYDVEVATYELKNDKGEKEATLYSFSYLKSGEKNRPVTFCFNGGPGSASLWLHLSGIGPKAVACNEMGLPLSPLKLEEREESFLNFTDLVFIDPVATGYSTAVDEKPYLNVDGDISSIANVVKRWLTKHSRWSSPKYLMGASYGTMRAVGLAHDLSKENFLVVDGIICISPVLDMQTISYNFGNDLPYALFLPSFNAVARYHGKSSKGQQEVEQFVRGDYLQSLFDGDKLVDKEKIGEALASFTGLKSDYVDLLDLRVNTWEFCKQLLNRKVVSRFDGRYAALDSDKSFSFATNDPWIDSIAPIYLEAIHTYLQEDLNWKEEKEYKLLNGKPWDYECAKNQYLSMCDKLRTLLIRNPKMKLFFGVGIYDLATPYFAAKYTYDHLFLPPEIEKNLYMGSYEAGHMFYMQKASFDQFLKDVKVVFNP